MVGCPREKYVCTLMATAAKGGGGGGERENFQKKIEITSKVERNGSMRGHAQSCLN